ncbi:MAG: HDOD domain-containing protein [Lentisphaerae bacterium]|nr:HDOD domain-containing protein [Lentisphaerota bacterium]
MKTILFVDDDVNVLNGLQRMLRSRRQEWEVHFAAGGEEALRLMETGVFHVVVSDMRMPGMDGRELLTRIRQNYPDTVRIILSGQSDRDILLKSAGLAHQFLSKPCDAEALKRTVESACGLRDVLKSETLRGLVSRIDVVPSLPGPYLQLLEELRSSEASIAKAGAIISRDMGMTAKILQLANSAFFGVRQHVTDPAHAASLLGLETIKALVLSVQVFKQFERQVLDSFSIAELWHHSVAVGAYAQVIVRTEALEESFVNNVLTAGLLHDIGKLVLAVKFPADWKAALRLMAEKSLDFCDAEREIFGASHAEVGAYLLGLWGMSSPVVEALAFHHAPSLSGGSSFELLTAVHVANLFDNEMRAPEQGMKSGVCDLAYLERIRRADRLPGWKKLCQTMKPDVVEWMKKSY